MSILDFFRKTPNFSQIEEKYAKIDSSDGFKIIFSQNNNRKEKYSAEDLLRLNKAWVNVCNTKNAMQIASTNLKLMYKNNKGNKLLTPHKVNKTLKSSKIQLKQYEELVEIEKHPVLDLLQNVNTELNYCDFTSYIQQYLGLIGNAYVLVEKNTDNMPVALYPLEAEKVTVIVSKEDNRKVVGYKYGEKKISYEDIIHFINYSPGSLISGKGELEYCIDAALRYEYYDLLEQQLNKNNARPDFVVSYKGKLSEKEQKDLMNMWYKKYGRLENQGKPIITNSESGVDITPIGYSPREMQYEVGRKWAREEIASVFSIPNTLIMLNEANYASSLSAMNQYLTNTIYPKLDQWCSRLNEKLIPYYDDSGKLFLTYEQNLKTDPNNQASTLKTYIDAGIMDVNEAREVIGLPPKKEEPSAISQLDVEDADESKEEDKVDED